MAYPFNVNLGDIAGLNYNIQFFVEGLHNEINPRPSIFVNKEYSNASSTHTKNMYYASFIYGCVDDRSWTRYAWRIGSRNINTFLSINDDNFRPYIYEIIGDFGETKYLLGISYVDNSVSPTIDTNKLTGLLNNLRNANPIENWNQMEYANNYNNSLSNEISVENKSSNRFVDSRYWSASSLSDNQYTKLYAESKGKTGIVHTNQLGIVLDYVAQYETRNYTQYLNTNIPKFNDLYSLGAWLVDGDRSGEIIDKPPINYKLYIDGSKNPAYALEWDINGIDEDILNNSNIRIEFEAIPSNPIIQSIGNYFDTTNIRNEVYRFNWNNVFNKLDAKTIFDSFIKNKFRVSIRLAYNYSDITIYNGAVMVDLLEYGYPQYESLLSPSDTDDSLVILSGEGEKTDKTGKEYPPNEQNDGEGGKNKNPNSEEDDSQETNNESKDDVTNKDKTESDEHTSTTSYDIGATDLMTIYKMSLGRLSNLGQALWSQDFFDNIALLNNSPIENIISCKLLPCSVSGSDSEIVIGNVNMGINAEKLSHSCVEVSVGSISLARKPDYGFLNYAPYTSVNIFLPFIGFKELDTNVVMGNTIHVKYIIDLITGGCKAIIGQGGYEIATFDGNCAINIPLTSNNRSQVEVGYITSALGGIASIGTGNVLGATMSAINCARQEFHSETKGAYNGSLGAYEDRTCYLIVNQPMYTKVSSFGHTKGYKCQLSKKIGNCKGFVKTTDNVDLSGVNAPMECKEEILRLLSSGVYV